jgi:hypothetical protein
MYIYICIYALPARPPALADVDRPVLLHARPFEPSIKSHFWKISSSFRDKCPQNGSKYGSMAPSTDLGYPHEGPSVVRSFRFLKLPPYEDTGTCSVEKPCFLSDHMIASQYRGSRQKPAKG